MARWGCPVGNLHWLAWPQWESQIQLALHGFFNNDWSRYIAQVLPPSWIRMRAFHSSLGSILPKSLEEGPQTKPCLAIKIIPTSIHVELYITCVRQFPNIQSRWKKATRKKKLSEERIVQADDNAIISHPRICNKQKGYRTKRRKPTQRLSSSFLSTTKTTWTATKK